MRRIIINMLLVPVLALLPMITFSASAYAACGSSQAAQQVATGIDETTKASCDDSAVSNILATIVNILSIVIGALSVIVIMISAFKYITSGGDQNKVANAKGTLTYALVGLAVAALAQLLVHLVLYHATSLSK